MNLIPQIEADSVDIRRIRHDIHAHPELGYEVHRTAELVASILEKWNIEVTRNVGRTGVVGTLRGSLESASPARAIGLRADMDALPVQEINTIAHASRNPGVMHACGHDGHTAMLLGAAQYLAENRRFHGTVQFIFQPAEEKGAGAKAMLDDGLLERFPIDAVFGLHNWPGIPANTLATRAGALMASSNRFRIDIEGIGAHAAMPHKGHDPLLAGAQIVTALQAILTRSKRPIDAAVLSVTQFHAGSSDNVIEQNVWLSGTVRTFDHQVTDLIERRMQEIATGLATAFGCTARVSFIRVYPPTINDAGQTAFAATVAREVLGADRVIGDIEPVMPSEDFSFLLQKVPGCYAFLGNGDGEHRGHEHGGGPCELHNAMTEAESALLPDNLQRKKKSGNPHFHGPSRFSKWWVVWDSNLRPIG
ncbi:M20 aminoacylase family protein [Pseudomonas viridiflava]|uniref:M20 aminoacylase family protein n=1 Tax=Pseudomonas viridiflava TaxID=33069 RepID=UPI000F062C0D